MVFQIILKCIKSYDFMFIEFLKQSFINIAVVTNIMPNTGTPLPFVSYGLTSMVSLYIGMGLVLNVGLQRYKKYREVDES